MSPRKIVLFIVAVCAILASAMWIMPKEGIKIGDFNLHMPSFSEMIGNDSISYADISKIIAEANNIDSLPDVISQSKTAKHDSLNEINIENIAIEDNIQRIEFAASGKVGLHAFFKKLSERKAVRILHYGDSQIEGDRITAFVRNKLNGIFGGSGPGIVPALQPFDSYFSMRQTNTGNWRRYAVFGGDSKALKHKKYGVLASFSRFAPQHSDSVVSKEIYHGEVILEPNNMSYGLVKKYNQLRIFYGNAKAKVAIKVFDGDKILAADSLNSLSDYSMYKLNLGGPSRKLKIQFSGYDSPDIYGISLDQSSALGIDNISLRGSSGTIFGSIDNEHLAKMYADLNVGLFILQFGGNVIPYTNSDKAAKDYGDWFYGQIMRIKQMCPQAYVLVIGPSDMSKKESDKYVTYPYLENVRDAMREAAFKSGSAFWDMYAAMGGKNSMPSWVNANPQLAGPDYTHFTPKGASVMANMFYNALMLEYLEYSKK